ncbi:MAG: ATP-binding cassette domain-containing protein [Saprospirales bacterium]|nr:MAG: ATP-binding cassette domain-containing protein [Saprospirales bacterium]
MLKIQRLSKTFTTAGGEQFKALDKIDLEIPAGSFTVVIGGNGSGKSTLLNLIAGNLKCDEGKIILNNREIQKWPDYKRARFLSRIFQDPTAGTAPDLKIVENFRLAAIRAKRKGLGIGIDREFREQVRRALKKLDLGLENKIDQQVEQLSGGQRQAITLLMASWENPEILLMDEPTAALDPKSARLVMELADEIIRRNNITAFLVTHQMHEAKRFGDRLIQLERGKIVRDIGSERKKELDPLDMMKWFQQGFSI